MLHSSGHYSARGRIVRSPNPIDVVEAAYRMDLADQDWLSHVGRALLPLADPGCGLVAYAFDSSLNPSRWLESAVVLGAEPELARVGLLMLQELNSAEREWIHVTPDVLESATEALAKTGVEMATSPTVGEFRARFGVVDFVALRTVEPGARGLVFTAGQAQARRIDGRQKRLWAHVSAHLAAARRLRHALAGASPLDGPEAVLTPAGKLLHAEGAAAAPNAREALERAVQKQELARGLAAKRDAWRAAEAWTALVAGRWSLVEQFERDGRRYLVALRNEHGLTDPRALTCAERAVAHLAALGKSNKLVAYELGVAESTVAYRLAGVLRKLGLTSRLELVRLIAHLGPVSPGTEKVD
jgi:DNA-binding CsgD family transcriptional regulator